MNWGHLADVLADGLTLFGGLCAAVLGLLGVAMIARFAWNFLRGFAAGAGLGPAARRPPTPALGRHAGATCREPRCKARLRVIGGDARSVDYRCTQGHAWRVLSRQDNREGLKLYRCTAQDRPSPEVPAAPHDGLGNRIGARDGSPGDRDLRGEGLWEETLP